MASRGRLAADTRKAVSSEAAAAALDAIYRAFFVRLVRRVSWRFGFSKEDASEVVQEAFIVALVKLDTDGDPGPWLFKTVDQIAVNWSRKAHRRARLMARWGAHPGQEDSAEFEGGEP